MCGAFKERKHLKSSINTAKKQTVHIIYFIHVLTEWTIFSYRNCKANAVYKTISLTNYMRKSLQLGKNELLKRTNGVKYPQPISENKKYTLKKHLYFQCNNPTG